MNPVPTAEVADACQYRRRLLLNLKCLVWCLHQMQMRYDLNLALYSLERRSVHPEIADSNLGDNLAFLLEHLEPEDLGRIQHAIGGVHQTLGSLDVDDMHFELGHYVQATHDFGPIPANTYGIISTITPQLRGLFYIEGAHLIEVPFGPVDVRTIFGTYIV